MCFWQLMESNIFALSFWRHFFFCKMTFVCYNFSLLRKFSLNFTESNLMPQKSRFLMKSILFHFSKIRPEIFRLCLTKAKKPFFHFWKLKKDSKKIQHKSFSFFNFFFLFQKKGINYNLSFLFSRERDSKNHSYHGVRRNRNIFLGAIFQTGLEFQY